MAAMECRDKPVVPTRKLVQARLPFKRLNPVPKEKYDADLEVKKTKSSQNVFGQSNDSSLDTSHTSMDNVENDCQLDPEMHFAPKLVNGKGPLDNFIQKSTKSNTSETVLVIDLTEDTDHRLSDEIDHGKLNLAASSSIKTANGILEKDTDQLSPLKPLQNTRVDASMDTNSLCEATANKDEDLTDATKSCSELSNTQCNDLENKRVNESELKGIILGRKMPVVVLEDIMTARSPQVASLEGSMMSESETMESSSPERNSVLTLSSLSSPSSISSPEVHPALENKSDTSPLASTPVRKVSQKCHRSSAEKEKLRLQRDQERADKLQKLQAEREEKGRLKEEAKAAKERAKEEAKKKKEEEKELKEKERREKKEKEEKEKAEKLRVKEEKRKERQEALEAKLEEKRKKEEEKRLKEEEKRINAQKAEITRFFQKPKTPQAPKTLAGSCGKFAPFEIKENMALAPLSRVILEQEVLDQLDQLLKTPNSDVCFFKELKCRKPLKSNPTFINNSNADTFNSDVVVVESCQMDTVPERKKFGRMKLLQFCENHRPAYWGTWNKKTTVIHSRNPWSKDTKLLDYEVDSDEEWEEEEPGESLSHSEEDDEEEGEDEDDDDGFFVPHGYLSEDEGVTEECDPENQKVRQKLKAKEWDELLAKGKRLRVLQPVKIGCLWENEQNGCSTNADLKVLQQFTACILELPVADEELQTQKTSKKRTKDQQILRQLLPLLHGNVNGSKVIIQEFQECCRQGLFNEATTDGSDTTPASPNSSRPQTPVNEDNAIPSKARLKRIISENSVYEKRPEYRMCWYVYSEVLKSFDQEHLPVPCRWNYTTQVPSAAKEDGSSTQGMAVMQTTLVSTKRKSTGSMSITKFMKRPRDAEQAEAVEMDGFQADTEEEEEEDDCMIVDIQPNKDSKSTVTETALELDGAIGPTQEDAAVSPPSTV
ncbi:chromatin assembly factor 1 subunit A [Alligator mississippiensis]|uniref:chromatin assembly factor 1 subunit A n=1 Tax=Alligator mississippiensis TaxID=8496 RepID=UPI0003D0940A|nr:chromatin assembly factor 1 subunit A [Alligator mississippiensis]